MARKGKPEYLKGSAYQKTNSPVWYIRVYFQAEKHTRATKALNRADAEIELAAARDRIKNGLFPFPEAEPESQPEPGRTFASCLDEWLEWIMVPNAKSIRFNFVGRYRAAKTDRSHARKWISKAFPATTLIATIKGSDVVKWQDRLENTPSSRGKPLAENTRLFFLDLLGRFMSWCVDRGYIEVNPVSQVSTRARPKKQATSKWLQTPEQMNKLAQAVELLDEPWKVMIRIGIGTGARPGEVVGLTLGDVAEIRTKNRIRIAGQGHRRLLKEDKDGGKIKFVAANQGLADFLQPWLEKRIAEGAGAGDWLFPSPQNDGQKPYCRETYTAKWRSVADRVGLETYTLYEVTRHTMATQMIAAGVPLQVVSTLLGHADTRVTKKHYVHNVHDSYSDDLAALLPSLPPVA